MDMRALTKDLSWFFLAGVNVFLLSVLSSFRKDKLHKLIELSLMLFVLIITLAVFLLAKNYGNALIVAIAVTMPLESIIKKKPYEIQKEDISWRPIFVACLFIGSCILGIIAIHFDLPWFTGYLLSIASFIVGLILYRQSSNDLSMTTRS